MVEGAGDTRALLTLAQTLAWQHCLPLDPLPKMEGAHFAYLLAVFELVLGAMAQVQAKRLGRWICHPGATLL